MNFDKLANELRAWLRQAKRIRAAARKRTQDQFDRNIAPFAAELAAYRNELKSADHDCKVAQCSARSEFNARPGANLFLDRNRGGNTEVERQTHWEECLAMCRAAAERMQQRVDAAEAAFAPFRDSLSKAQQSFDFSTRRADRKLEIEELSVKGLLAQLDYRQNSLSSMPTM